MNQDHLSAAEVAVFREDSFSSRSLEIGRHLLVCKECRAKLPSITPQEFRNCILDDAIVQHAEAESKRRCFDFIHFPILSFARAAAIAAFAVLLVAGIFIVGVYRFNTSETTVAKSNEDHLIATGFNPVPEGAETAPASVENEVTTRREKARSAISTDRANPKKDQGTARRVAPTAAKAQNSETRGKLPCGGQRSVGLEARRTETGLLLKWDKVRGAVAHNVYLSDLDERLIDHFETADQTSYEVSAELDIEKVYRLRLIVTLESGERIVSESQNFRVGDLTSSQSIGASEVRKKTTATVRCLETKQ